jgi:hypothetical protein
MKRAAAFLSVFALGLAVGAAGVLLIDLRTRATYREVLRSNLLVEQELLAARTARQGDRLRSLVHRWNVVDARSEDGFRIFRASPPFDDGFFFPFALLSLKEMVLRADESRRGSRVGEGLERGKLALALEAIGSPGLADEQWRRAQDLLGRHSLDEVRRTIEKVIDVENSDAAKQAAGVVLDGKSSRAHE